MFPLASMTYDELIAYLRTQGTVTETEAVLLERLIAAMDEVDALTQQLADQQDMLAAK